MDTTAHPPADLDASLQALLAKWHANDAVREGLAAFDAATARVGNPSTMNFAPVTYSTSGNR